MHMRDLFTSEAARFEEFSLRLDDILFDHSKNRITRKTLDLLIELARQASLAEMIAAMFSGEKINNTEGRAVLHSIVLLNSFGKLTPFGDSNRLRKWMLAGR